MRWPLWVLYTLLPLQWFVIGFVPYGQGRLHLLAMMGFLAWVVCTRRSTAYRPVLQVAAPFFAAETFLILVWTGANAYFGRPPIGPLQDAAYMAACIAIGVVIYRAAQSDDTTTVDALRWVALLAGVSLVIGLSIAMSINGINPGRVFANTIKSADPEILQRQLFRTAFGGFGYSTDAVKGNIRHEIFAAVLSAMYVSGWAVKKRPLSIGWQVLLFRLSMLLGAFLILVSMSRSCIIAAMVWPLLSLFRSLVTGRLSGRQVTVAICGAAAFLVAIVTGLAYVIWVRFTQDTSSYTARSSLLHLAITNIREHWLVGGVDTTGSSAHNFVLDSWQRSGIFGALAAVFMTLLLIGLFVAMLLRMRIEPSWMLPVTAALALPIVRIFTAGGGVIPPVEWVDLGFVAGAMAAQAAVRASTSKLEIVRHAAVASRAQASTPAPEARPALSRIDGGA